MKERPPCHAVLPSDQDAEALEALERPRDAPLSTRERTHLVRVVIKLRAVLPEHASVPVLVADPPAAFQLCLLRAASPLIRVATRRKLRVDETAAR